MPDNGPPAFIQLAGHEVRWRLLKELSHSDRRVRELMATIDQPQNLVSYHLGKLRTAGLVSMRRSNADGRDVYYHLDLARCAEYLAGAATALHPALTSNGEADRAGTRTKKRSVAFLCTGNSARSPMAAAILRHRTNGAVETASAGSEPKPLHPFAKRALERYGIDLGAHQPTHLDTIKDSHFDFVISLCDKVREVCPDFPDNPDVMHWSIPDPAVGRADYKAYESTAKDLDERIRFLIPVLDSTLRCSPAG